MHLYFGTTIDALEGNSSGPVINADSAIIGVMLKVSDNSGSNGFRYDGNETSSGLDWHSLSTRCEYLQRLKVYFENGSARKGFGLFANLQISLVGIVGSLLAASRSDGSRLSPAHTCGGCGDRKGAEDYRYYYCPLSTVK